MTDIRAVWTDFGGVLTPPVSHTLAVFCEPLGIVPATMLAAMRAVGNSYGTDMMGPLDIPLLTEEQWARRVEQVLRSDHGVTVDLSNFADRWFTDRETNLTWLDTLRRLRAEDVFVGMLSNMVPSWDRHWRQMVPPQGLFDDVVLSFEVGHRKPDPGIFELAAKRAGLAPERCVLVDDLDKNCAGARALGWQAIHFTSTAEAITRLRELLGCQNDSTAVWEAAT
ncbi:MAG: HAD family hydrolase [Actinomycetes bacterium]